MYALMIGVATGGGYLCYVASFRAVGAPSLSLQFFAKLAMNPWFIAAILLSGSTIILRPFVYEAIGATRGYWVLISIAGVASSLIVIVSLREHMTAIQWVGVMFAFTGAILVSR